MCELRQTQGEYAGRQGPYYCPNHCTGKLSRVLSTSHPMTAQIGFSLTATLSWISRSGCTNGWTLDVFGLSTKFEGFIPWSHTLYYQYSDQYWHFSVMVLEENYITKLTKKTSSKCFA